jgi:hypothetical protein
MTPRAVPAMHRAIAAALLSVIGLGGATARADNGKLACVTASAQAQQLRDEGKLKKAREQMLACARDSCPQAVRKDCSAWLAALDTSMPSIVLSAQDATKHDVIRVRVTIDGKPLVESLDGRAVAVDPGPHVLRFEMDGRKPVEQRVLIREGEQRRAISIQFPSTIASVDQATPTFPPPSRLASPPPDTTPVRIPIGSMVLGGVALAALGSFAFFGITGKNDLAALRDTCGVTRSCAQEDVNATRGKLIVADVSLGVSVVALGVATGLLIAHNSGAPPKVVPIRVDVLAIRGGAAATLSGNF